MSTALENALEAIDLALGDTDDPSKLLVRSKVRALMRGYDEQWRDAGYEALAIEETYTSPLWNPDSLRASRTFRMSGKVDVLARGPDGMTYLIDHKTTSENITDPDSPYWRQLTIDGQVSHYMYLLWLHEMKVDGAVWDVIHKPTISPKKLTKAERASAVADRKYCGQSLSMGSLVALQTEERETLEMYEARLVKDCTKERPEWYFQRRPVPRLDNDLFEYAQDLWEVGQQIRHSRGRPRLPKHSGACMNYGTPCKFLGICSGHDTPDSDRWKKRDTVHPELPGVDGDVLTNSRIRTYQLCPVKHRFEYELAIERYDEEEKEALFFGSLAHLALEVWWAAFLVKDSDYGNDSETGSPVIGIGKHSAATT